MASLKATPDECVILVKALPHRSSNYYETVCCAGVGRDGKWRRQYPVPYRVLTDDQKFGRWEWIEYQFTPPNGDNRRESQKVVPDTIKVTGTLRDTERSRFLDPIVRASSREAEGRGESLALVRPRDLSLSWRRKPADEIAEEAQKHRALVAQQSFLQPSVKPMTPCPYEFSMRWTDGDGVSHNNTCDDWETATAFYVRRKAHGELLGLQSLRKTFEDDYMKAGMALAIGTHSRRNQQWLLVGIIRLDRTAQPDFLLSGQ